MTLHVHGNRIHRDVRRGQFNLYGKGSRVTAETLRPNAKQINGLRQRHFKRGTVWVSARGTQRSRRGALCQMHTQIRRSTNPNPDNRGWAGLATSGDHAINDKTLDRINEIGRAHV